MTCADLTQRVLVPGSQLRIGNAWVTVTGLLPNAGGAELMRYCDASSTIAPSPEAVWAVRRVEAGH